MRDCEKKIVLHPFAELRGWGVGGWGLERDSGNKGDKDDVFPNDSENVSLES